MRLETSGLDKLILSMEELAGIPDSVVSDMLQAGAAVVAKAHAKRLEELGLVKTGRLKGSIKVRPKMRRKGDERYTLVYPSGTHHTSATGKATANSQVGFILEAGAPRRSIKAYGWMRDANEQCADEAVEAEAKVYDDYLKSKGF